MIAGGRESRGRRNEQSENRMCTKKGKAPFEGGVVRLGADEEEERVEEEEMNKAKCGTKKGKAPFDGGGRVACA